MLSRRSLILGFILIWTSLIAIPLGTHFQTLSPNFREYEQHAVSEIAAQNPGKDLGPGVGVGLALSSAWPFVGACCTAITLLFTAGVLFLRQMVVWNRTLARVVSGIFICGCFGGSLLGINEATSTLQWGFIYLGAGYLLLSAGLTFGALGVLGCYLRGNR